MTVVAEAINSTLVEMVVVKVVVKPSNVTFVATSLMVISVSSAAT